MAISSATGTQDTQMQQGIVQQLASPIVNLGWVEGYHFGRGMKFQCFASTEDGAIVVGSMRRQGFWFELPSLELLRSRVISLCLQEVIESGKQERHLVVAVRTFSVVWDFQWVKQTDHECYRHDKGLQSCYCYEIVPRDKSIIESRFMNVNFHSIASLEASLVLATPKKISSHKNISAFPVPGSQSRTFPAQSAISPGDHSKSRPLNL